ncbi:MAG: histidine--tRNA ligase [Candidatus Omnitrophica bacterium]|nr:histidine--tRNA ligase [Candidatus Omnitrophota bacterium]
MKIKSLKGTNDILSPKINKWRHLEESARRIFECYGYQEIRTPIIEHTSLFKRSIGEETDIVQKEMFTFSDNANRSISLRPEETPSVARAYIEHNIDKQTGLAKFFYIGPMFRSERPQAGRYRQFHQFGAEAIGSYSPYLDAEIIALMDEIVKTLKLKNYEIQINSLGCGNDRHKYKKRLAKIAENKPRLISKLCVNCQRRIKNNPLRILDCKNPTCRELMDDFPTPFDCICEKCLNHYEKLKKILKQLKIPFKENRFLVRGLDYYTGTTFELTHTGLGAQNAICGGGRYDNLISSFGGPEMGACGFAFGIERLLLACESENIEFKINKAKTVYIAALDEPSYEMSFEILHHIRQTGIQAHMAYEIKSLKAQMRQANRLEAGYVIIIGENELKSKTFTVKDMAKHTQTSVDKKELLKLVAKQ